MIRFVAQQHYRVVSMKRVLKGSALALLAMVVVAGSVSAQSVAGTWNVVVQSPDVGEVVFEFTLEQEGTAVHGKGVSVTMPEMGNADLTDGLFEDGVLSILMHMSVEGQGITVEIEGDVDGDEMVGEAYVAEMGSSAPFVATRES